VTSTEAFLRVPGARLYYRLQGAGPLLLVLQGGAGDADASEEIVDRLTDRFTVLTYDRRGLSRSALDPGTEPLVSLRTHASDAHRLLSALTSEPAILVGHSIGAVIALEMIARYPKAARTLVAHEPSVAQLLPPAAWFEVAEERRRVSETYRLLGAGAALKELTTMLRVDTTDREPGARRPKVTRYSAANLDFFFAFDVPASRRYVLDLKALAGADAHIVLAAGENSRGTWIRMATELLAERLGSELLEFPGDHDGFALHPRAFATRFREILLGTHLAADTS